MHERTHGAPAALGVLAICLTQIAPAAPHHKAAHAESSSAFDSTPVVLQTFPAAHADLALVPCRSHDCAIQVRLLEEGRIVDRLTLPVTARLLRVKNEAVDESWGADPGLKAWRTGFESDYVSTAARTITLAPGTVGLLVTQRHNFEPMKHEHLLVLAHKDKLRVLWRADEGTATWSATEIVHGPRGNDVAYLKISPGTDGIADHFEATRLHWDAAAAKLTPAPLPDTTLPLQVLSLGRYDNTAKAGEARTNFSFCLSPYWVLDASAFAAKAPAVVGKIYVRRASAEAALHATKTCLPDQTPAIVTWQGTAPAPGTETPPAPPAPAKTSGKKLQADNASKRRVDPPPVANDR